MRDQMFGRKQEPAIEPVRIEMKKCEICGSLWFGWHEVQECTDRDMLRFIYEKLGGTYPNAMTAKRSEGR